MFGITILTLIGVAAARVASPIDFTPVNQFSLQLLENIYAYQENFDQKNVAVSPLSIWNIFALLAEGSAGETFTELVNTLRLPEDLSKTQCLHTAASDVVKSNNNDVLVKGQSAIFTQCSTLVNDEFCESALKYDMAIYASETVNATELAHDINVYICLATDGRILHAVKPSDLENLEMVLVDALYFKANWTHTFDRTHTKISEFYDTQGRTIGSVNMMHHKARHFASDDEELQAQILEMTYGTKEQFSMIILLPFDGIPVKTVLHNLATKSQDWVDRLRFKSGFPIETFIPKFKINSRLNLIKPMQYSGIQAIFDSQKARLPGVAKNSLFVSSAVQNVDISVDEEGTEAASSTVVGLEDRILGRRFEANKEFIFLVTQRSCNAILFAGVYGEPSIV